MKNKIFTQLSLAAMLCFASVTGASAQAKSTFAGDVNINPLTGREFGHQKVAVAYNGDVYVSRLVRLTGETNWGGYQILKSTDAGITFEDLVGNIAVPINTSFTDMDIIACGNNDTDFKLVVARSSLDNVTGDAKMGLYWYNNAGNIAGATQLSESTYNYSITRGWDCISLSSDTKMPAQSSAPFSVSLVAVKASTNDSIVVWTGNTGGTSFTRRSLAGFPGFIRNVSSATGSVGNFSFGRLGIVWDEYELGNDWANVKAHFIWPDDATDFINGGPYNVGSVLNEYRNPVISMANDASLLDHKGCITYQYFGSGSDIYTRIFNQLIDGEPQVTNLFGSRTVANDAGDQVDPYCVYNPEEKKFLFTYYNADNDALVYKKSDLPNLTTDPVLTQLNYRDNQNDMTDPKPRIDGISAARNFIVWSDQYDTYIDMEIRWPASVQNTSVSVADMKLYPNPATDNITLTFTAEQTDKAILSIIDMSGRTLQHTEASVIKGGNKLPVALNNLPAGNYTLRVSGGHTNTAVMFTVQH